MRSVATAARVDFQSASQARPQGGFGGFGRTPPPTGEFRKISDACREKPLHTWVTPGCVHAKSSGACQILLALDSSPVRVRSSQAPIESGTNQAPKKTPYKTWSSTLFGKEPPWVLGCGRPCKQCVEFHKKVRSYKKHTVVSLDSDVKELVRKANEKESMICAKHTSDVLRYRYFCLDCEALACIECLHLDHAKHKYKVLESLFHEAKSEIQLASSVLEQTLPRLAQAGSAIIDLVIDVDACNVKVKKEIEKAFAEIMAAAEKRKQELLVEVETMAVARKTRLQMQQEYLEKLNVATKFTLDTIKHGTQFYSPVELHSVKAVLKQSCTNLGRCSAKALLNPATSPPVVASVHTVDIITAISKLRLCRGKAAL